MGSDTSPGRVRWPVRSSRSKSAAEGFLSNTGPWESQLWLRLPLWPWTSCFLFPVLRSPCVKRGWCCCLALACSAVWHVVCQISQLRSGSPCTTATEINQEHQKCSLSAHPGLLSQNPPPLPVFTGDEQETNQKTSKTKDWLCKVCCKPGRGPRQLVGGYLEVLVLIAFSLFFFFNQFFSLLQIF